MTYRMIIKTEDMDRKGRPTTFTERIPHVPAERVEARRALAQKSAPRGATRTITVIAE